MIPVVMLHRDRTSAETERAFEGGANDFLSRPFSGEAALGKLDRWVLDRAGPAETWLR
jgi:CheY-like chemotaxis protein